MKNSVSPKVSYAPTAVVFNISPKGAAPQLEALRDRFHDLIKDIERRQEFSKISAGQPKVHQYSGACSFIQFPALLAKEGLYISGCYINVDDKLVFTIGKTLDVIAERLFLTIADHTGWSVVEFRNADLTKVWAANNAHPLTDQVKLKGPKDAPVKYAARNWRAMQVWVTRV